MFKSKLHYLEQWPNHKKIPGTCVLIYDVILEKNPSFKKWLKNFEYKYPVAAGEKLKNIDRLPLHLKNISQLTRNIGVRELTLVAAGGGSVGDFVGFIASTYKRGVRFIQIPSTWLAAIDSAHGGKNAMNISGVKNQIGTIYYPSDIFLMKELLLNQPEARVKDALGEVYKISLIQGGSLWKKIAKERFWNSETLWKMLPDLVAAKYKVVRKDPFEKSGYRHILNLGHTLGHVIEAQQKLSHGLAVLYGLHFSLWLSDLDLNLPYLNEAKSSIKKLRSIERYLKQDKKRMKNKIRFIVLKKPGHPLIKEYSIRELEQAVKGFLK